MPIKLSSILPPLVFGTATFNYQFNVDPYALNPNILVEKALDQGIRAFDTSPYYGPAEEILGAALTNGSVAERYQREQYFILTKVGRIASDTFDYSPEWVRYSVRRSCKRLKTKYLDVVYCHDVEFVSQEEVLAAVTELRRIRDQEGWLHYVGIAGYPVDTLCDLAGYILRETGEPLDAVQSYANFTLQNTRLLSRGLDRFVKAGVDVVPNASPLGMGLLRSQGVPVGAMGNWHPAPDGLRKACLDASNWTDGQGEKLAVIALRYAMEVWMLEASEVGVRDDSLGRPGGSLENKPDAVPRLGVSVIGVSKLEELGETMRVWNSVLDGISDDQTAAEETSATVRFSDHDWPIQRRQRVRVLARKIREIIGEWTDAVWDSPSPGYVNQRKIFGVTEQDERLE